MPTPTHTRSARRALLLGALALPVALLAGSSLAAYAVEEPITYSADDAAVELAVLGTHRTGVVDASAAEIVAFHDGRAYVVNADAGIVDVLDATDPSSPTQVDVLDAQGTVADDGSAIPDGAVANSVAIREDGLIAVALEAPVKTDAGWIVFFDAADLDGGALGAVRVGSLPDMVTLTPDGNRAVVANEGEPADDFSIDPEGSVGVIDLPDAVAAPTQDDVRTADFHAYEAEGALPDGVRVFGPTVSTERPVSANLEPEYATVGADGTTAYVSLQEANAIAVVDLDGAEITEILPLGAKDHSLEGNGLDPSDRDEQIAIAPWPVLGLFMPDAIESYEVAGDTYLVTANEGDAREWGDYLEPARVKDLGDDGLAPICEDTPAAALTSDADLGRLNVSTASGLAEDGSCYEDLYAFGARSFSIWSTDGELVFDSGDQLEQIVAAAVPDFFSSNHTESNLEGRSDDKGPEPEGVAIGELGGRTYAFVGFERVGGIAVFDISTPADATFVTYLNNRDFSVSLEDADDPAAVLDQAGDLGPEGLAFVPAADAPGGEPLLIVGNEVSGTTTFFSVTEIEEPTTPPTTDPSTDPTTDPTTAPSTDPTTAEPTDAPSTDELAVTLDGPVRAGDLATARVSGAGAGERLDGTFYSDPVDVGSTTAGQDGTATLTFRVPADAAAGTHRLVVTGESGTAEVDIEVLAAESGSGGGLADTGVTGVALLAAAAALAITTGAALVARRAHARRAT